MPLHKSFFSSIPVFRPCIDLHKGKVKQIVGSSLSDNKDDLLCHYESSHDVRFYAEKYKNDHLDGGHVIMLGPDNSKAALEAVKTWPGAFQVGGGMTASNASHWLNEGAQAVIVTSYVFYNGMIDYTRLKNLVKVTGPNRLVLDLSAVKRDDGYYIATDRWQKCSREKLSEALLNRLARFSKEFLIHAVDAEGKQNGIDRELVEFLGRYLPVKGVYAGGIRNLDDIKMIEETGQGRLDYTVGSALDIFGGKLLKYKKLVERTKKLKNML